MINYFEPINKKHSNFIFKAPESMPDCGDLHVTRIEDNIISNWKISSLWERFKFLFHGEITLTIYGQSMPPVSLGISDAVIQKEKNEKRNN